MKIYHIFIPVLALVSFISCPLPVIVGWVRRKYLPRWSRIFLGLLSFYLLVLSTQLLLLLNYMNSVWIVHVYCLIESCVIAGVYLVESDKPLVKDAIRWAIFVFCAFWLIAKLTFEPMSVYDNYTAPFSATLLIVMATYKLIELLKESRDSTLRKSMFWISTGIIIYYVGTMPLFSLANMLLTRPLEEFAEFWKINWGLTIVANLIYTKAFTCKL